MQVVINIIVAVGGGEAGCLLAGRLSEHFSVLLLGECSS